MKRFFIIMIFTALAVEAGAQGIERQRARLAATDQAGGARVEVREDAAAARAIAAADKASRKGRITGYCVNLFGGNNQSAGDNARSVAAQFRQKFPDIPVRVEYKSPYFNVMAGSFADKMDAIMLCGKALEFFRNAVVRQEEILVSDIVRQLKSTTEEIFTEPVEE